MVFEATLEHSDFGNSANALIEGTVVSIDSLFPSGPDGIVLVPGRFLPAARHQWTGDPRGTVADDYRSYMEKVGGQYPSKAYVLMRKKRHWKPTNYMKAVCVCEKVNGNLESGVFFNSR